MTRTPRLQAVALAVVAVLGAVTLTACSSSVKKQTPVTGSIPPTTMAPTTSAPSGTPTTMAGM